MSGFGVSTAERDAPPRPGVKVRRLEIHGFKAIDELTLEFPPPLMDGDPDVMVVGSANGVGKTSVLEACALLLMAVPFSSMDLDELFRDSTRTGIDARGLLVRGGCDEAIATLGCDVGGQSREIQVRLPRQKSVSVTGTTTLRQDLDLSKVDGDWLQRAGALTERLLGLGTEPLLLPLCLYFHSYRKVQEGNPDLALVVEPSLRYLQHAFDRRRSTVVSAFKLELLRAMMGRGGLFEEMDEAEGDDVVTQLNRLLERFAQGTVQKLRASPDNTLDFRITPRNGNPSFPFDGLSSGQKEIISTMFLIWRHSRERQRVVLIDEPELHLNPDWQRTIVADLHRMAPQNQYLIATHSEDVYRSVGRDRRILLTGD